MIGDGGPAFPVSRGPQDGGYSGGQTLADYFATHADSESVALAKEEIEHAIVQSGGSLLDHDQLSIHCKAKYLVAQKMLQARGQQ